MKRGYSLIVEGSRCMVIAVAAVVALTLFVGALLYLEDATVVYDGNGSTAGSVPV